MDRILDALYLDSSSEITCNKIGYATPNSVVMIGIQTSMSFIKYFYS